MGLYPCFGGKKEQIPVGEVNVSGQDRLRDGTARGFPVLLMVGRECRLG